MKKILIILTILLPLRTFCQELFFVENFYDRYTIIDSLTRFDNYSLTRYATGGGDNFYVTNDLKIVIPNLYDFTVFDLHQNQIDTIIKIPNIPTAKTGAEEQYLLSFDMTQDQTIYYELAAETYRLDFNECNLYKFKNSSIEKIDLPNGMNFINFDISPNGERMAFAFTEEKDKYNIETLFVFDLFKRELMRVDTAYQFGFDINEKFTFWENHDLFYSKNGIILKYDLEQKSIKEIEIPISKPIDSFVKLENNFYLISDRKLWLWNGTDLKLIYEPKKLNYISTLRIKE
ncbi:hypothetical protein [uncultured Draconibacterium sp.]|uniref:hypothetical protein n=1 Tax=uncultured Draconibacterium sp. TaxID=1573823 RepID=UPI0032174D4C